MILRLVTPTTFKPEILKQKIVLAYIIFISIPGLYSYFNYNYMLLTDPSKGYEHCDNRALGEILLQVPLMAQSSSQMILDTLQIISDEQNIIINSQAYLVMKMLPQIFNICKIWVCLAKKVLDIGLK